MKTHPLSLRWLGGVALAAMVTAPALADGAAACTARSGPTVPTIVELYTSEGCSSCPPADQWLSTLKSDASVHAFAFHVEYWDYIGWKDRFAHPVLSQRQAQQLAVNGGGVRYTPQVVRNGTDERRWPALVPPLPVPTARSLVDVTLARDGERYTATITTLPGAPSRVAAWWAVTEHGHTSRVSAGENRGEMLKHDFVVREYRPVAAWSATAPTTLQFAPTVPADATHPRQLSLVVVDATTGKPLQAVRLACS